MRRALPRVVVLGLSLSAASCVQEKQERTAPAADAILNGSDQGQNIKQVFMIAEAGGSFGSAANITVPRCLLTAGHVNGVLVAQAASLRDASQKRQNIEKAVKHPATERVWTDLQVLWLKAQKKVKTQAEGEEFEWDGILEADYDPAAVKDSIGQTGIKVKKDAADKWIPDQAPPLPASVDLEIRGYGRSRGIAGGGGVQLKGSVKSSFFGQGSLQNPAKDGGFYFMESNTNPPQLNCDGDSGGPVYHGGKVVAVISTAFFGENGACANVIYGTATTLDKNKKMGGVSNFDWLNETVTKTCGKELKISSTCGGKVDGTIAPGHWVKFADDHSLNEHMRSGVLSGEACNVKQDTVEMIHSGQTITLTATADTGYVFDKWTGTHCPCGAASTCVVPYSDVGHYTNTESIDTSTCVAEFVRINPAAPPPTACCTTENELDLCWICLDPIDDPTGSSASSSGSGAGGTTDTSGAGADASTGVGGASTGIGGASGGVGAGTAGTGADASGGVGAGTAGTGADASGGVGAGTAGTGADASGGVGGLGGGVGGGAGGLGGGGAGGVAGGLTTDTTKTNLQ